ncbi:DUF1189 domain-containing protein, partial [Listeria monocytogenes]|nr:DUF1189 domain-containing protein [Listeria monocytogenes]
MIFKKAVIPMKKIPFIIQYVKSTLGPTAIFEGRKVLKFWQMV